MSKPQCTKWNRVGSRPCKAQNMPISLVECTTMALVRRNMRSASGLTNFCVSVLRLWLSPQMMCRVRLSVSSSRAFRPAASKYFRRHHAVVAAQPAGQEQRCEEARDGALLRQVGHVPVDVGVQVLLAEDPRRPDLRSARADVEHSKFFEWRHRTLSKRADDSCWHSTCWPCRGCAPTGVAAQHARYHHRPVQPGPGCSSSSRTLAIPK